MTPLAAKFTHWTHTKTRSPIIVAWIKNNRDAEHQKAYAFVLMPAEQRSLIK